MFRIMPEKISCELGPGLVLEAWKAMELERKCVPVYK
jgi:hypothetical protein